MNEITRYRTLAEAISIRAQGNPDGRACVFLSEDGQPLTVSNGRLYDDMKSFALGLMARGIGKGEIVLIACGHGYEPATCFWGAVCCGAVPSILTYWIPGSDADAYARKVGRMAAAVRARAVITLPDLHSSMAAILENTDCLTFTAREVAEASTGMTVTLPEVEEGQVAFMQFTSGTTGAPKALQFSHRTILDHIAASAAAYRMTKDWVYVSWLPFYHDMGLIGHIRSLLHGDLFVSMAPRTWLRRPEMLLQAVHRYRGTLTNMPNFSFDYCAQRIRDEDLAGVDLSSWRVLTNGAEPALPASMQRFSERFAAYGLREGIFAIGYGMAENVCGISMTLPGEGLKVDWVSSEGLHVQRRAIPIDAGSPGARAVVACGYPFRGVELAILGDRGEQLTERDVGEIAVKSNTLFTGYYLDPDGAEVAFRNGWFLTGDLGYCADGQLYVCGRKKDLIIVGGRNVHPHAIENIAAGVFGESAGRCAAFGLDDQDLGTEVPVLVVERRRDMDNAAEERLIRRVRQYVSDELDIVLADVRTVPRGWLVKTTSGKLARAASREKYQKEGCDRRQTEAGPPAGEMTPEQIQELVIRLFQDVLGTGGIGPMDDFIKLGGDSLSALRLFVEIERRFGRKLPVTEFFQRPTAGHMAEILSRRDDGEDEEESGAALPEPVTGSDEDMRETDLSAMKRPGFTYEARLSFLTWLYGKRWAQRIFKQDIVRVTRSFYALLEKPAQSETEAVRCAMLISNPGGFQIQLLDRVLSNKPACWSLRLDMGPLERVSRGGKGVILVGRHAGLALLVRALALQRLKPNGYFSIKMAALFHSGGAEALPGRDLKRMRLSIFLDQLLIAKRVLSGGGIVYILPDARDGLSRGIRVPFHGRVRNFKTGFAELALETGSPVVPVSMGIDFPGREVTLAFLEPLDNGPADMPQAARVEGLVVQYAAYLREEWSRWPGTVFVKHKRAHCDAPSGSE